MTTSETVAPAPTVVGPVTKPGLLLRQSVQRRLAAVAVYALLLGLSFIFLIPLAWMLSTALKSSGEVFLWPPKWIPDVLHWENFTRVFVAVPFGAYIVNTLIIVFWNILGNLISCSLVAFAFARLRFPGRNFLFGLLIATLMIPGTVLTIPTFILFKLLGWYNTYLPLIVPSFFGSAFYIFLLRQYMLTLPLDLDDAARIDGASWLQILLRIILPLCKAPLTIIIVFTFMGCWNDLMGPLIYVNDPDKYTVAVGLAMFKDATMANRTDWTALMAASLMSILPIMVIYYFAQKHLIGGIASVGLKG
ncbi:MAG: carbohydrate ABC transporter permease [Anaerolineales bacterium]|nr:carbohydrate ABC transporter permease [Anaerolineales bacterium]